MDRPVPAMKRSSLVLLATLLAGCAASADSNSGGNQSGSSSSGGAPRGDAATLDGQKSGLDAGVSSDGSPWLNGTLNDEVPSFHRDAGTGGKSGNAGSNDGGVATGGSSAAAGSAGSSEGGGKGGYVGAGGGAGASAAGGIGGSASAGGATATGGRAGATTPGGATGSGGSGGHTGAGGSGGRPGAGGSGGGPDAGAPPDSGTSSDAGISDGAKDGGAPDTAPPCVARIRALRPISLDQLVAGPHVQIVLRAERDGTGAATWNWRAVRDRTSTLAAEVGQQDPAAAAFRIDQSGSYVFTASDNSGCAASVSATAEASDACKDCDRGAIVRASPPSSTQIPTQAGYAALGKDLVLQAGVPVEVAPTVGSTVVDAYVRILCDSETVVDGLSDLRTRFKTRLLAERPSGQSLRILQYNVLVVPADGTGNGTIGATAPQLFRNLTPAAFAKTSFQLVDGIAVSGTTAVEGSPVADARWVLSNQEPGQKASGDLLFSSVGRSESNGRFLLNVQAGSYRVSISPPVGSGLAEAISSQPVNVRLGTTLSFEWTAPATASINLRVQDAQGNALPNARVRLATAEARAVGTLLVNDSSGGQSLPANGSTRLEVTTSSSGVASFANVPANVTYTVLVIPEILGPLARTTVGQLRVVPGTMNPVITAQAEAHITGTLLTIAGARDLDLSQVTIVAHDKSDESVEPTQSVRVGKDGRFDVAVTPGRPYVLMAIPPNDSDYARTLVDPGPMVASEFSITQVLFKALPWHGKVLGQSAQALSGTALQMFCDANWPNCLDSSIPLAETSAASDGSFTIALPDPTTR